MSSSWSGSGSGSHEWSLDSGEGSGFDSSSSSSSDAAPWETNPWEEEESTLPESEIKTKDALIFLVDFNSPMFVIEESESEDDPGEIIQQQHWNNVIQLIIQTIKNKIITSPDDLIGLVLFGTKLLHNNDNGFESTHIIFNLSETSASMIKECNKLLDSNVIHQIGIGEEREVKLNEALWCCGSMFGSETRLNRSHKRVLIFTTNDTPYNDNTQREKIIQKGKDLKDTDIQIEVMPLNKSISSSPSSSSSSSSAPPPPFNPLIFYKFIWTCSEDENPENLRRYFKSKFEDLKDRIFKKTHKKRALGTLSFHLGEEVNIALKVYCNYREQKKEAPVMLDKETNDKLETETKWICDRTGAVLEKHQIQKYFPYGGAEVKFNDDEVKKIKEFGPAGLTLMGFKPKERIKLHYNLRSSYFLYPDDYTIRGSIVATYALIKGMSELKQVAIARFIYRKGSIPRFVALLPQVEVLDDDQSQLQPPGFHCIFLPYADDIRNLKFDPMPITDEELKTHAKKVVDALSLKRTKKFESTAFNNPTLQKHYSILEAIALDEKLEGREMPEDLLWPDVKGMEKHQDLMEAFKEEAGRLVTLTEGSDAGGGGRKRKIEGDDGGSPKVKKEEVNFEDINWEAAHRTGTLGKLTIPVLKVFCKKKGLAVGGKKEELVSRVVEYMDR